MTDKTAETSQLIYSRVAGFMYLFVTVTYMFGSLTVSDFIVSGNFAETVDNILANERLFRIGLASQLLSSLSVVLLALAFYVLLKPIDGTLALLALLWRLGEATLGGVMALLGFVTLDLYSRDSYVTAFEADQLQTLVEVFSGANRAGFYIATIFFALGSTIFFYLLFRSKYIPRILSAWGVFASLTVLTIGFANLTLPDHTAMLSPGWMTMFVAEISTGLWLLLIGARVRPQEAGEHDAAAPQE